MADIRRSARTSRWHRRLAQSITLGAGLFLVAGAGSAHAQINPFRGYHGPALTKEDLRTGHDAAAKLLTEDHAEVGRSEEWSGPASGNGGTISVQKEFRRKGMSCRTLKSLVRYKDSTRPQRTWNLDVCQIKSGEWKLM